MKTQKNITHYKYSRLSTYLLAVFVSVHYCELCAAAQTMITNPKINKEASYEKSFLHILELDLVKKRQKN